MGEDLALIVVGAPGKEVSLPDNGLKGRALPEVEGVRRLDIVVTIDEKRLCPLRPFPLAIDDRGARGLVQGRLETDGLKAAPLEHGTGHRLLPVGPVRARPVRG